MATSVASRRVLLVGSPNVGKTALFNALTGTYVSVSNYPGTTVEVFQGHSIIGNEQWEVVDTPGTYSLTALTEEGRVTEELLLQNRADVVLHVVDAKNIHRMLPFTVELLEAQLPVILVVNMVDEAERLGVSLDTAALQQRLGIPVVTTVATHARGLEQLKKAVATYPKSRGSQPQLFKYPAQLEAALTKVAPILQQGSAVSWKTLALLFFQRDPLAEGLVRLRAQERYVKLEELRQELEESMGSPLTYVLAVHRRKLCEELLSGVFLEPGQGSQTPGEKLSQWLMQPLTGIPAMIAVLYFGFYKFVGQLIAGKVVDFLNAKLFEGFFNQWVNSWAARLPWPFQELVGGQYGILTLGVRYATAIVLPIVGAFFVVFSVIEDSGYLPRLAALVDRVFKPLGLSGRAVIPMVLGLGCGTMATLVTRTLETKRERLIATILLALAIPCSAQLGLVLGLLSREPRAMVAWLVTVTGAFMLVGLLSSKLIGGEEPIFFMEIPPLRWPQLSNMLAKTWARVRWYFLEVLPLFVLASALIWLGQLTGLFNLVISMLKPAMAALGLPQEAAQVFIFGFFRRDYGAAGLYDLQAAGMLSSRQLAVAATTLTLFIPCVAQFLIMLKERGAYVATQILCFVLAFAFGAGALLNAALLAMGW
ncbi:MAG: ferrous iron transport protein B [Bacillota bacterium]